MHMHIAVYATAWCLSVCMSIMCHYCIKMAKPMIKDWMLDNSQRNRCSR